MSKTSKMEQKLLDVTKVKPKANEDREDYFKRIITAVQELPEDVWEGLDEATQKWVNDGAKAGNDKQPINDFPDIKAKEDEDVKTEKKSAKADKTAKADKAPKKESLSARQEADKPAKKKDPKADKAPKKEAKADKPAKKAARGSGLEATIKGLIVKKPAITADELVEKLEAKNVKASRFTVVAIRAGFRHSIKVLQEADLIKGTIEL